MHKLSRFICLLLPVFMVTACHGTREAEPVEHNYELSEREKTTWGVQTETAPDSSSDSENSGDAAGSHEKNETSSDFAVHTIIFPSIQAEQDTITDATITAGGAIDVRKNININFHGTLGDGFVSATIGHGDTGENLEEGNVNIRYAAWVVVDDTYITVYANQDGEQKAQYPHGLTIERYLHVLIQQGDNGTATITINSGSGRFREENVPFNSQRGCFFATVAGTMTDVTLTTTLTDLNAPVWFFGDSYQGLGSKSRYPFYLAEDGFIGNCLISGFPGAGAQHQRDSFENLIRIATPQYVVWTLGMNNSDKNGSINKTWMSETEAVIAACEEKGITVILSTIPNVPDREQSFKNDYIRNRGVRYIDFAMAVGGEESGSGWYNGMLASDGVHPTETGALALYAQLLADFPEIIRP